MSMNSNRLSVPAVVRRAAALGAVVGAALLAGCAVYPDGTVVYSDGSVLPAGTSAYDRAFSAASGALSDQGLRITVQDRASGQVVGTRGNAIVTASVRPQPDGTTRVEFKTSGDADPGLAQRVVAAYNARMGR
jgi:hexokinase